MVCEVVWMSHGDEAVKMPNGLGKLHKKSKTRYEVIISDVDNGFLKKTRRNTTNKLYRVIRKAIVNMSRSVVILKSNCRDVRWEHTTFWS
uniref:Uncharacterized protein n=1 Tax=Tanacetum cinerariifolium TaxID=118510 RepID=A0A6L2KIV0_TANCI|nr:hypothetical protein [Tanacetum cinerariifolium]